MKEFHLRVLAPERMFFDGKCVSLMVPTIDGMYGLMAQHEDLALAIVPGKMTLRTPDGAEQIAAVSEGVLKMDGGEALMLVSTVERPEEIDLAPSSMQSTASRSRPSPAPASPARSAASTSSTTENDRKTKIRTSADSASENIRFRLRLFG